MSTMDDAPLLERLAAKLWSAAIVDCCRDEELCDFHRGYWSGMHRLIEQIEYELVKVGYRGT